jgi:tetratricopeptide (TPR) repeat protein
MTEKEELQQIIEQEMQRAAKGLPRDPLLSRRRGALLGLLREYEQALSAFDETEEIRRSQGMPVDPAVDINRGCALRDMNRTAEARAALERAEAQYKELGQPPHPALAVNLGGVLRNMGRADESLLQYDKAVAQSYAMAFDPHYTIYMNRGVALYTLGRIEEAMESYEQAERERVRLGLPPDPLLMLNRASVFDTRGQTEEAIATYDEAERISAERGIAAHPHLALNRGHALLKLGRREEALEQFNECIWRYGRLGAEVPQFVRQRIAEAQADPLHTRDLEAEPRAERPEEFTVQETKAIADAVEHATTHTGGDDHSRQHDAFLSHRRRDGGAYARLLKLNFEVRGRRAFLDVDEREPSRRFDERLLRAIENSSTFVLLLTPGALERCVNEGDWLRKEISHALNNEKLIVPVMLPDFKWPKADELPEDIRTLTYCEGLSYSHDYFPAFMDMLVSWCSRNSLAQA